MVCSSRDVAKHILSIQPILLLAIIKTVLPIPLLASIKTVLLSRKIKQIIVEFSLHGSIPFVTRLLLVVIFVQRLINARLIFKIIHAPPCCV